MCSGVIGRLNDGLKLPNDYVIKKNDVIANVASLFLFATEAKFY